MTAADVNVTELVARRLLHQQTNGLCDLGRVCDLCDCFAHADGGQARDARVLAEATDLLAALRSPEVVAGIAGVLGEHRPSRWRSFANDVEILRCCGQDFGPHPTRKPKSGDERKAWDRFSEHQARAVVEWLAGGGR